MRVDRPVEWGEGGRGGGVTDREKKRTSIIGV